MSTAAHKASSTVLAWTERGLVPDSVIRAGIRRLCRQRLKDIRAEDPEASGLLLEAFVRAMNAAPVALLPEDRYSVGLSSKLAKLPSVAVMSMRSTRAAGGPIRSQDTSASIDSAVPSIVASTLPSRRLRTQPVTPRRCACSLK